MNIPFIMFIILSFLSLWLIHTNVSWAAPVACLFPGDLWEYPERRVPEKARPPSAPAAVSDFSLFQEISVDWGHRVKHTGFLGGFQEGRTKSKGLWKVKSIFHHEITKERSLNTVAVITINDLSLHTNGHTLLAFLSIPGVCHHLLLFC